MAERIGGYEALYDTSWGDRMECEKTLSGAK